MTLSPWLVRAIPVAALAALAACVDEPTTVRPATLPPAAPTAGAPVAGATAGAGGYRLTIAGIGTAGQSSDVLADGGAGAAASVLADGLRPGWSGGAASVAAAPRGLTPRANALQFQFVATGSYTYGTRGTASAYRYVYAMYRVRNQTGAALSNLALLAASRTTDLAGTAISAIGLAGGATPDATTAASLAKTMLPAGASILSRSGQPTAGRTDVLQIFTEADARSVAVPSPYTALAYGYTVLDTATDGRAIAATSAGDYPAIILFAFKVPLQSTASQDVFTFSFDFYPVTDAETRVTQSAEERDAASASAVSARATAIGATEIHVLSGSTLAGSTVRAFCGFRIAGAGTFVSPGTYSGTDCYNDFSAFGVSPGTAILLPNATRQLTTTVTLAAGSTTPTAVSYQSDNTSIATVSATGLVTAVGQGTATIYVSTFAAPSRLVTAVIQVDATAPVLNGVSLTSFATADQARIGAGAPAQSYSFDVFDNMGYDPRSALSGTISRLRRSPDAPGGTVITECATSVTVTASAPYTGSPTYGNITGQPGGVCPTLTLPTAIRLTGLTAGDVSGEYTVAVHPVDAAGNAGTTTTLHDAVDLVAPTISAVDVPATLTGGQSATFGVSASDNLELYDAFPSIQYGTAFATYETPVQIGTLYDALLANTASGTSLPVASFIRSVTLASAGVPPATAPTAASAVTATVTDAGSNAATSAVTFAGGTVQNVPGSAVFATGVAATNVSQFTFASIDPSTGNATASNPTLAASPAGGEYGSLTLRVDQIGAGGVYTSPFQRIDLYVRTGTVGGAPRYRLVGSFPATTITEIAGNATRQVRTDLTLTPSTYTLLAGSSAGTAYELRAVGVTANGDALVSDAVNVTIRNP